MDYMQTYVANKLNYLDLKQIGGLEVAGIEMYNWRDTKQEEGK